MALHPAVHATVSAAAAPTEAAARRTGLACLIRLGNFVPFLIGCSVPHPLPIKANADLVKLQGTCGYDFSGVPSRLMNAAIGIVTGSFGPAAAATKPDPPAAQGPASGRPVQGKHQGECKPGIKVGTAR
jgi:hypothetical protein